MDTSVNSIDSLKINNDKAKKKIKKRTKEEFFEKTEHSIEKESRDKCQQKKNYNLNFAPESPWQDIGLHPKLIAALLSLNFFYPTSIQQICLPKALSGCDILGAAPTGSGKTLAFGLPILNILLQNKKEMMSLNYLH